MNKHTRHFKLLRMSKDDRIVTVFAEPAAGPGWANQPLYVVIKNRFSDFPRIECLQPDEQGRDLQNLYSVSASIHGRMKQIVEHLTGIYSL